MSVLFERTAIVGVGLIGASLAAAGRRTGALANVTGVGRSRANLDTALELGLIDSASHDVEAAVADADLVVLGAPVDTSVALLSRVVAAAPAHAVFTDVGSVKGPIVTEAARLDVAERFVGVHPMAGSTDTGAAAADASLFEDAVCVITPSDGEARVNAQAASSQARVRELWLRVGGRVVEMDAHHHDRTVAEISHMPHMVSFALALTVARSESPEDGLALAAGGFRDTTRLAKGDADMWIEIARTNREEVLAALDRFAASLGEVTAAVRDGDEAALRAFIDAAGAFRRRLDK